MLPSATQFFKSLSAAEKRALCEKCGISIQYLYNLISRPDRKVSIELACKLEMVTRHRVTRRALLPALDWDLLEGAGYRHGE